jgi:hypothetical protein
VLALSPARLVMFSAPRGNSLSAAYAVTGESRRNCFPRLAAGIHRLLLWRKRREA